MAEQPKIWLSSPHMGGKEQEYVNEAFASNWIAPLGPHVNGFEKDLQEYNEIPHAAALTSGTGAMHIALDMLGVGPGDYVICQSFTFCGSTNPITYLGATPILVDSEEDSWNICPEALEKAILDLRQETKDERPKTKDKRQETEPINKSTNQQINPSTSSTPSTHQPINPSTHQPHHPIKAIIPVHLYGNPAKMDEIQAIAHKYGIPVIEDAAESLGSLYKNKKTGTMGEMGVYSFNGNKIITTSGGGALVSPKKEYIDRARFLATQARDQAPHYQHSVIGYNYRLSNVLAGIGRGQMAVLDERIAQRRANCERYRQFFETQNQKGYHIVFQEEMADCFSNRWLTTILVDPEKNKGITREDIRLKMAEENIEARPLWKPMHLQPVFETAPYYTKAGLCPTSTAENSISDRLFEQGLCLPSGSNLTEEDWQRIEAVLRRIFS